MFSLKKHFPPDDGGSNVFEFEDAVTGLRHIHVNSQYPDEFFMAGFQTPCSDDSGVFHALEHLLLTSKACSGNVDMSILALSKQMNINMINASTTTDLTHFHFSSSCTDSFKQFMSLTLNAVLFPEFGPVDFQRELFRVCESGHYNDAVVLNEMKAALSSPTRVLLEEAKSHLFGGTSGGFNSGGKPEQLYQLSLQDIRSAHQRYFKPGNCVVVTLGPDDGSAYHRTIHKSVVKNITCAEYQTLSKTSGLVDSGEHTVVTSQSEVLSQNHYVIALAFRNAKNVEDRLLVELIYQLFMGEVSSPLRVAFLSNEGKGGLMGATGYQKLSPVPFALFSCEIKDEKLAETIKSRFLQVLTTWGFAPIPSKLTLREFFNQYHKL